MPAVAKKKYEGQSGEYRSQSDRQSEPYIVTGATSIADAITATLAIAPATITTDQGFTLHRVSVGFEFITENPAGTIFTFEVTVHYGSQELQKSPSDTVRIRVTTGGGTQHITQAKTQTVYKVGADAAPDFKNAIGVTADSVEGVDIGVPVFRFVVTKVFDPNDLPALIDFYTRTWTTNLAVFTVTDTVTGITISLLAGEGVLEGVEVGEARTDGNLEVVFNFSAAPNMVNITVGAITGISKKGWQYLWAYYVSADDGTATNKALIQKPKYAVVNGVFDEGDWSSLGL